MMVLVTADLMDYLKLGRAVPYHTYHTPSRDRWEFESW